MEINSNNSPKYGIRILIIGSGFVGSATGLGLLKKGYDVTFVDIKDDLIKRLKSRGLNAIHTSQLDNSQRYDYVFICLPTPYDNNLKRQDMSIVRSSVRTISKIVERHGGVTIAVRSTVIPGTCRSMINRIESITNRKESRDFYFCMNPEFLRAKTALEDFLNPWAIVIGANSKESFNKLSTIYQEFIAKDRIYKVSLEEAEMMKYIHNIFNATKISFSNQVWLIARELGIDGNKIMQLVSETAEGSWNKKYGIVGGLPYGGLCLPKDTKGFLTWLKDQGIDAPLINAVDKINEIMQKDRLKADITSRG